MKVKLIVMIVVVVLGFVVSVQVNVEEFVVQCLMGSLILNVVIVMQVEIVLEVQ